MLQTYVSQRAVVPFAVAAATPHANVPNARPSSLAPATPVTRSCLFTCGRRNHGTTFWAPCRRGTLVTAAGLGFGRRRKDANKVRAKERCPCGSQLRYADCCGRYHSGEAVEPSAEAVMKARFSAYVKNLPTYVCDTTHPDNPSYEGSKTPDGEHSSTLEEDVKATCRTINFTRLDIQERSSTVAEDGSETAELKIEVGYRVTGQKGFRQQGAQELSFRETARYARAVGEGSRWLYLGGEVDHGRE